ncbi:MAG: DedA family protein [Acidimicrobiia bacterium]|nr:DedA family protein [Acidimicrobiia bacterium]
MDWLTSIDGWMLYAAVGLLVFGESAAFLGLIVPGEFAMLAAGAAAAVGTGALGPLLAVAIVGAILGSLAGYALGVRWGSDVLRWRAVERRLGSSAPWVMEHLSHRGELVVMLSRFNAVTRALVPALAGTAGMPLRGFVAASSVGGVVWATAFLVGGFVAGSSWKAISAGSVIVSIIVVVLVAGAAYALRRHGRAKPATEPTPVGVGLGS